MEKKDYIKKIVAGAFFIFCVMVIVGVVSVLGVEKGFNEPKFRMTVLFHEVGGLTTGGPVRLSGVIVGTVANIDFLETEVEGRGVKVQLNIFKRYQNKLRKLTRVAVITEGVLGEKVVEIKTSALAEPKDLSVPFIGEDPLDVQNLAENFGHAALSLRKTAKKFDEMSVELEDIFGVSRRVLNRIEQRIVDGNLFKVF